MGAAIAADLVVSIVRHVADTASADGVVTDVGTSVASTQENRGRGHGHGSKVSEVIWLAGGGGRVQSIHFAHHQHSRLSHACSPIVIPIPIVIVIVIGGVAAIAVAAAERRGDRGQAIRR